MNRGGLYVIGPLALRIWKLGQSKSPITQCFLCHPYSHMSKNISTWVVWFKGWLMSAHTSFFQPFLFKTNIVSCAFPVRLRPCYNKLFISLALFLTSNFLKFFSFSFTTEIFVASASAAQITGEYQTASLLWFWLWFWKEINSYCKKYVSFPLQYF